MQRDTNEDVKRWQWKELVKNNMSFYIQFWGHIDTLQIYTLLTLGTQKFVKLTDHKPNGLSVVV